MTEMTEGHSFSQRLILAHSWWIATELCRRHSQLRVVEHHPFDGHYNCLGLFDDSKNSRRIDLNRFGSLHVHYGERSESFGWTEIFSEEPFEVIERLEADAGLKAPKSTLPTTPRLLCYRVITSILLQSVNTKTPWQSMCLAEKIWDREGRLSVERDFGGLSLKSKEVTSAYDGPEARHWALNRRAGPIELIINDEGILYQREKRPIDLFETFKNTGRSISATIGEGLGNVLK